MSPFFTSGGQSIGASASAQLQLVMGLYDVLSVKVESEAGLCSGLDAVGKWGRLHA